MFVSHISMLERSQQLQEINANKEKVIKISGLVTGTLRLYDFTKFELHKVSLLMFFRKLPPYVSISLS